MSDIARMRFMFVLLASFPLVFGLMYAIQLRDAGKLPPDSMICTIFGQHQP